MESTKEKMLVMHNMCQKELSLLKINLKKFIEESERCQKMLNELNAKIGTGEVNNIFGLIVFDRYMTQVVTVLNMARKFNIHLEINSLYHTVDNTSFNGFMDEDNYTQTRLLKDFIECRKRGLENRELTECIDRIKMTENIENFPQINEIDANNNKNCLVKCKLEANRESSSVTSNMLDKINNLFEFVLPKKCLNHFQYGYEFNAFIVYVRDYKQLEFFICQMEDYNTLYDLSSDFDFKPIPHESLSPIDVFCVLEERNTTVRKCFWRAVLVPAEHTAVSHKFAYLLDFGDIIPLTEKCTTYAAPLHFREIPPLAIKCILEGIENSTLNSINKNQEKCETALFKNEFENVMLRLVYKKDRELHVIMLENCPKQLTISIVNNNRHQSNPFMTFDNLGNDDEISSVDSAAALQLPRSVVNNLSPSRLPILDISAKVGDKLQIIVTHVATPISFYGIIQNDYSGDNKTFSWHDHQIFPLQKQMSKSPQINDILLAQYIKDNYWYRAKVINIDSEKDLYKIFYVDFGNTEIVPLSNLAKCTKEQLKDPFRAVLFHLANLSIITNLEEQNFIEQNSFKKRLKSAFENMVVMILDQILNVEVVERRVSDDLVVRLIDTQYAFIPKILLDMAVVNEI